MTDKAYVVQTADEEHAVIVFAPNGNKARSLACGELDSSYIEVRARRAPEFDAGRPSDEVLCHDFGWCFNCNGPTCYRRVDSGRLEEGAGFVNGDAYCSACMKEG